MCKQILIFIFITLNILSAQVSYNNDISPILNKHCTACHSTGNIGPMPLTTYDQVVSYATMIKYVTSIKLMPPFKADYHKVNYKNERSISLEEIAIIEEWIDNGLLEGDSIRSSVAQRIRDPEFDHIVCMEKAFTQFDNYYDQFQAFILPLSFNKDIHVKNIKVLPGNNEIVRSAHLSIIKKGAAKTQDKWDPKYGFYAYGNLGFEPILPNIYSWMPNTIGLEIDTNEFALIPAYSDMILHVHYGPSSEIKTDSTCVGIDFDDSYRKTQIQNVPLISTAFLEESFLIEEGLKKRITTSFHLPSNTYLKSITPLAHLLCTHWEVFAILPDKTTIPLLSIKDWDFNWKEKYVFLENILLPKNTKIVGSATYDNTSLNPYNPSYPPRTMKKGPYMFDENFVCYFELKNTNFNPLVSIKKPFAVSTNGIGKLAIENQIKTDLKISLINMTENISKTITQRKYPPGSHTIQSSDLPNKVGRYAIIVSSDNKIHDTWYFVIK